MSDPFVAEIRIFAGNFAPTGWATCDGQLLPISQNTALFSLLGTFYGGDGKSTFALPNLQGNCALGSGQGSGLGDYFLGQESGSQFVTLLQSEIPFHTHSVSDHDLDLGDLNAPAPNRTLAQSTNANLYHAPGALTPMSPQALALAGGGLPHNNMMPYLTLTYIIAMQGVFPPRG